MDFELQRELNGLKGDLNITKLAVSSVQEDMKEKLMGDMGDDMKAVLNGDIVIKPTVIEKNRFRIKSWFKRLFRKF